MIKSSDIKEHLFLYCSSGWWWVSNTIRLLWIHLEESRNSSEYARHTYVYEQTWIYTQSAFHMLMLIQQTANWKNNTRKKSFPESSKKKNLESKHAHTHTYVYMFGKFWLGNNCFVLSQVVSRQAWEIKSYWRRQWHPTAVLLPGKSHGWRSLVGYSPWGR